MTFTTIDTTTTTEVSATTQNFDTQLSILNDKGFNQKLLNLRLLSKFEGDLEKVEKRLTQIQKNQSSLRERILSQYQSSIDQLSQRGFSDHPRLPALLKKFDGDVDQIISFIERSSTKPKKDKAHPKKIKDHTKAKGLKNKDRSASPSPIEETTTSSSSSSLIEETTTSSSSSCSSSSCSDPTPSPSTVETLPTTIESPVPDQTPKSSNDKAERKAKKQALKQQIRELQAQMKEIKDLHSAQKEEKERKKKERQEKLILREAKILKNLSDLKTKSSKTNEMIQRQEDQLAKIRSFLSAQA